MAQTITFEEPDGWHGPTTRTVEWRENPRTGAVSVKADCRWVKVLTRTHALQSARELLLRYLSQYGLLCVEQGLSPALALEVRLFESQSWYDLLGASEAEYDF